MKIFKDVIRLPEFNNDLKELEKRFKTIGEDLEILINNQLALFHKLNRDNKGIFEISDLGISYRKIFKVKKFACRSLKGRGVFSGLRLIYAYYHDKDIIELVEIYFKGDKTNEDRDRILKHYKENNN